MKNKGWLSIEKIQNDKKNFTIISIRRTKFFAFLVIMKN